MSKSTVNRRPQIMTVASLLSHFICLFLCGLHLTDGSCPPCHCSHDNIYDGLRADCSSLNLSDIPPNLPANVTILNLADNKIQILKTGGLKHLTSLREVELCNNEILNIEEDAFLGASLLKVLRLDSNSLVSLEDDAYAVFDHLIGLQVLNISFTHVNVSGHQLAKLKSVQAIYLDCHECRFSSSFLNLTFLVNLTTSHNKCNMNVLTNSTFLYVPYLESLTLQYCGIEHIEPGTFEPLKQLKRLDLSWNLHLGIRELVKGLPGLRNSPTEVLKFNFVNTLESAIVPLEKSTFRDLKEIPLKELHIDGIAISYIGKGTFESLPKTLETLSLRYTMLGDFAAKNFTGLYKLSSLKTLDVTDLTTWNPAAGNIRPQHHNTLPKNLTFPPKLQVLKFAQRAFNIEIGEHDVYPPGTLKAVYLNNNFITSFTGPVTGIEAVEYIDLSSNILRELGKIFLLPNNSLTVFNISYNDLGNCFEEDSLGEIFSRGSYMKVLDISNNRITSLPRMFFKGLKSLEHLDISNNEMFSLSLALEYMTDLQSLDLSFNKLKLLPVNVQNDIDALNKVVVNLEGNPLSCSCESQQFLKWISMRENRIYGFRNITCLLPNGTQSSLKDIGVVVSTLDKECSSNVVMIAVTVSTVICVLVALCGILVYKHRWKLRYLYYAGRRDYRVLNRDDIDYCYDAFVSYADDERDFVVDDMIDKLEKEAGLKLCLHYRDFRPGTHITQNIVNSIQDSRKTLIVLSPSFLKSEWCAYEFQMALRDGIARKQNIIVAVMYKEVSMKDLPKELALMFSRNSYLEYNDDLLGGIAFWENLREAIKIPEHLD